MINLSSAASTRPPHAYPAFPTPDQMLPCLASKVMAQKHRLRSLRTVGMQVQGCSVLLKSIEVSPWYLAANAGLLAEVLMAEAHAPCVAPLPRQDHCGFREILRLRKEHRLDEAQIERKRLDTAFVMQEIVW